MAGAEAARGWAAGHAERVDLLAAVGFVWLLPPSRHFVRRQGVNLRFHLRAWGGHLRDRHLPWLFAIPFLAMGVFLGGNSG
ncbi:hypothetical protein NB693_22800 [Pantoea ananatis]|uniref:hypothetical protein n=1 Tax=Pantoea ananas TaxID=553 RepID=UPI00221FF6F4|nr:hypothetical protein [Pantoea ananatis]